ncbi:ankyrin repeat-containing protein [Hordeum vulgare]|uniref:PGG domain-containing protein n=1 Tax=Hordeum vulgare subsp. vulgare TaxID=112509 RepID=A0A287MT62_HORVV|nr:ankyrin repeat-containing protein NPR4-like [Hordeum vulgare subsp. vulgare]KAE8771528.1 ankyrin repeat-containing protein [Hordeum vulgare]
MADNTSTTSSLEGRHEELWMDQGLLEAATYGDSASMKAMASQDPDMLLRTTPAGNTCLHISSIHGHEAFCMDVVALKESLLTTVNVDRETPLLAAVKSGFVILASVLLRLYCDPRLSKAILEKDIEGCNVLHHAIRSGHRKLALELIKAQPALSTHVNRMNESPMYIAAMRDFTDISEALLEVRDSAHMGPCGQNTLQAAVKNGNAGLAKKIMKTRPWLAKEADKNGCTPLSSAVYRGLVDVARVLLEHDFSLGYEVPMNGNPFLSYAAYEGHLDVAQELLKHCPDTPYRSTHDARWTSLHVAVYEDQVEFTEFLLRTPQLRKLINMRDSNGKTALHLAVEKCNPKMVVALLSHDDIDTTVLDNEGVTPAWVLAHLIDHAKTLNWNEVSMLMVRADPRDANTLYNLHTHTKHKAALESRKEAKSLTQTYTTNTSLVAILITTVTFAAAFTLPGGYSNDARSEGVPIMSRKFAFQAFLISDVLAMCSSFAVAFICIIARWGDYEFLIYYISATKKLMWFAYVATTTAFSTGLYTVLAPHLHWLAIAICLLVALLPILTKLLGEWPVWKLRLRLGKAFNSHLLDMV